MTAIAFVAVAAASTLVRVAATAGQPVDGIPWRTFAINIVGSFLLGLVVAGDAWNNPIVVTSAGLGSLTTFSTVAAETAGLLDNGRRGRAIVYVGLTVVVGVTAAAVGLRMGDPR